MGRSTWGTTLGAAAIVVTMMQAPAAAKREIPVMVQTVPPAPGIKFALNGESFVSDENGLALITVSKLGTYRLEVMDKLVAGNNRRSEFSRWSDDVSSTKRKIRVRTFLWLQAGFDVSYRTQPRFTLDGGAPVSPQRIDLFVLRSDEGVPLSADGGDPVWIPARTLRSTSDGVKLKPIAYTLERVVVDGRKVTPTTHAPLVPTLREEWEIALEPLRPLQPASSGATRVTESSKNWLLALVIAGALVLAGALWLSRMRPRERLGTSAHIDPPSPAARAERVIDLRSHGVEERSASSHKGGANSEVDSHELDDAILEAQRFIERLEAERRQLAEDQAARHGSSRGQTPPQ